MCGLTLHSYGCGLSATDQKASASEIILLQIKSFKEFALTDSHGHASFEKLYSCFASYVGRERGSGDTSAKDYRFDTEQCQKDFDELIIQGNLNSSQVSASNVLKSLVQSQSKGHGQVEIGSNEGIALFESKENLDFQQPGKENLVSMPSTPSKRHQERQVNSSARSFVNPTLHRSDTNHSQASCNDDALSSAIVVDEADDEDEAEASIAKQVPTN
ncbi:hypothetical protein BGX27_000622, partial [Mortierella sp. AM989]